MKVTIDIDNSKLILEGFRFTSQFLPESPRSREEVLFSEVIDFDHELSSLNPGIRLRTSKGSVLIPSKLDDYSSIESALEEIVDTNHELGVDVPPAPKIKTAWYGWVILAGVVVIAYLLGQHYLYSE